MGGLEEEQRLGVRQQVAGDSGPRLREASTGMQLAVLEAGLTIGKAGRGGEGREETSLQTC